MNIGADKHEPVHPGEVLVEHYLKPLNMTAHALSLALHVPASRINDIVLKRRGISADTALRLAHYFGGDAKSWLNLQTSYDLKVQQAVMGNKLDNISQYQTVKR